MMRLVGEVGPEGRQGRNQREVGPKAGTSGPRASRIKDQESDQDQESRIKGQGSRIKDQR